MTEELLGNVQCLVTDLFVDRQRLRKVAQLMISESKLHQRSDVPATGKGG